MTKYIILFISSVLCFVTSEGSVEQKKVVVQRDTVGAKILGRFLDHKIIVDGNVDLKGCVCVIPPNMLLEVKKGSIRNGILVGQETKMNYQGVVFDRITIAGSWNVPIIRSSMFQNLDYENSLKNVMTLASPKVQNKIIIERGIYRVAATSQDDRCLTVCSNTEVIINGTISLSPNNLSHYKIIHITGKNISIRGNGCIEGDKSSHTGVQGEWGMGINIWSGKQINISGITVKDCWGDCVYIGGCSKDVTITNCKLDKGRRQGVSITNADGIIIKDCMITNVGGTAPEYAIDLEPNKGDVVTKIVIERVEVKDCEGGFLATKPSVKKDTLNSSRIGDVVIKNCKIAVLSKYPLNLKDCEYSTVEGCTIVSTNGLPAVYMRNVNKAVVRNNTIMFKKTIAGSVKEYMRKAFGKNEHKPITIIRSKMQVVTNNKLIEL